MYAPPWARDGAREEARAEAHDAPQEELCDAPAAAADNALAASEQFRRVLPPASQLSERRTRWRETPFDGDLAVMRLREKPTLDPVTMPAPPLPERGARVLTRVAGAVALAALAAFFMVGTAPLSFPSAVKAETDPGSSSLWSRLMGRGARQPVNEAAVTPAPLADRFAAMTPQTLAPQILAPPATTPQPATPVVPPAEASTLPARPVQTVAIPVAPPAPEAAPRPRALDRDEIATLYRRSEELISQGDIAGGRLLLTRAAEAGDARSALALGATYDPAVLGKLGVLGVKPDAEKARTWYAKASEFGSAEAVKRLEVLAQGR
jgi:hypothetical protein